MRNLLSAVCNLVTAAVIMQPVTVGAAQFIPLGFPTGRDSSIAEGISPDGSFVVGSSGSIFFDAFRWSESDGFESLGALPAGFTAGVADDASVHGSVVVGTLYNEQNAREAFRWTETGGVSRLGVLPGMARSWANVVSADGSTIVGASDGEDGVVRAFRWTEAAGMEELDLGLQPTEGSIAFGVSADGSKAVGVVSSGSGANEDAFKWVQSQGVQLLAPLPGHNRSAAFGISADGSIVVGSSDARSGDGSLTESKAVRWTDGGTTEELGDLFGDDFTTAVDASADGSVIIGMSLGDRELPFLWTESGGMRSLVDILTTSGNDLSGWDLGVYNGSISDDGLTVTGWGRNPDGVREAWIARLNAVPEPSATALLTVGLLSMVTARRLRNNCSREQDQPCTLGGHR